MVLVGFIVSATALPATAFPQARGSAGDARLQVDTATIGAQLVFEHVEGTEPWVMLSGHRTFAPRWGVATARLTVGERFGSVGIQGEVEAYPRVGRIGYLYAAAAASPHEAVFIPFRGALELFTIPSRAFELSAGARLFQASSESVIAYTASIGAYRGNYWGAIRPYVVRQNGSVSTTGQFSLRRYWAGRYDYIGLQLSGTRGADPIANDPARIERGPDLTTFSARVERLRPVRRGRMRVGYGIGIESEEVAQSRRRLHLAATVRIERLLQ